MAQETEGTVQLPPEITPPGKNLRNLLVLMVNESGAVVSGYQQAITHVNPDTGLPLILDLDKTNRILQQIADDIERIRKMAES